MRIDTHHHFWKYNPAEYGWISDPTLQRDFLPDDLAAAMRSADIDAAISVQARETLEETHWLLDLAAGNPFVRGVVGWLPLAASDIDQLLTRFCQNSLLCGVRHVLQNEPANQRMEDPAFNAGLKQLLAHDLTYDLLIHARHLPQATRLVDRHPDQRFVLDHIAKPPIKQGIQQPWADDLRELARRQNVWCKISGMVTEADLENWNDDQLRPYLRTVLDAFGPHRILFGSDWPVCLMASTYPNWVRSVKSWVAADLSPVEQKRFWHQNALEAYRLPSLTAQ